MATALQPPIIDLEALRVSYDTRKLVAERFATRLSEQITELLNKEGISLALPIENRVKSWESISDKIDRNKLNLSDVATLNDFIGLRLILLFRRDVGRVRELLSSELHVLSSEDTLERLGAEQFGYQSIHLQLKLPDGWYGVPTFAGFRDLTSEIQVRTAAQHIWAAASHALQYKHETGVPIPVRRSINRVAALLETVDLEFERVLQERREYRQGLDTVDEDSELNVDVLRQILDAQLPQQNRDDDENYAELLADLSESGITTVRGLKELIASRLKKTIADDETVVRAFRSVGKQIGSRLHVETPLGNFNGDPGRIKRGVFYTHSGLIRSMIKPN